MMMKKPAPVFLGIFLLLLSMCGREERPIVARIGDRIITADEFRFNYAFAPRTVTWQKPEKARLEYLNRLIDTILLAREGEKRGFHKDAAFRKIVDFYKGREIIRELYRKHIRDSVTVSEPEIREAYQRSKITLYIQHFTADTKDEAEQIVSGKMNPPIIPLLPGKELPVIADWGQAEKISWNELNQEIEDLIYQLPLFQFSEPLHKNGKYHLFRVVFREQEVFLTENDFRSRGPSLKKAIRKRKEHKAAFAFIQRIMKPQNVIIKAKALNRLADLLLSYHNPSDRIERKAISNRELNIIRNKSSDFLNEILAEYGDGKLTMGDFLWTYRMNPQELSFTSVEKLQKSLKNCIAIFVRDRVFLNIGLKEGLDESPAVQEEERAWREKLLAGMVKSSLKKDTFGISRDSSDEDRFQKDYKKLATRLRAEYNVVIYHDVLDSISISNGGYARNIDFVAFPLQ